MITLSNVNKFYPPNNYALRQVTMHLQQGDMAFLTGHSGAGKSTILKLIAGLESATRGQVVVNGKNLTRMSRHQLPQWRRSIGILLQDPYLLYDKTVFDNVALPLVVTGYKKRDRERRVRASLELVGLRDKEKSRPIALSTGELQRAALARALVIRPHILLADEPTGNLDPELTQQLMAKLQQLNSMGVTMLIATHDQNLISHNINRMFKLQKGYLINEKE